RAARTASRGQCGDPDSESGASCRDAPHHRARRGDWPVIGRKVMGVMVLVISCASRLSAQVSVRGGAVVGRAAHRVVAGALVTSSGTLLGGTVAVAVGQRFEIQGEA